MLDNCDEINGDVTCEQLQPQIVPKEPVDYGSWAHGMALRTIRARVNQQPSEQYVMDESAPWAINIITEIVRMLHCRDLSDETASIRSQHAQIMTLVDYLYREFEFNVKELMMQAAHDARMTQKGPSMVQHEILSKQTHEVIRFIMALKQRCAQLASGTNISTSLSYRQAEYKDINDGIGYNDQHQDIDDGIGYNNQNHDIDDDDIGYNKWYGYTDDGIYSDHKTGSGTIKWPPDNQTKSSEFNCNDQVRAAITKWPPDYKTKRSEFDCDDQTRAGNIKRPPDCQTKGSEFDYDDQIRAAITKWPPDYKAKYKDVGSATDRDGQMGPGTNGWPPDPQSQSNEIGNDTDYDD